MSKNQTWFDKATQIVLPILTISGYWFTANKNPQLGFGISLVAQIFWLYTAYVSYKRAGQIGILITTIIMTAIMIFGLYNWTINP